MSGNGLNAKPRRIRDGWRRYLPRVTEDDVKAALLLWVYAGGVALVTVAGVLSVFFVIELFQNSAAFRFSVAGVVALAAVFAATVLAVAHIRTKARRRAWLRRWGLEPSDGGDELGLDGKYTGVIAVTKRDVEVIGREEAEALAERLGTTARHVCGSVEDGIYFVARAAPDPEQKAAAPGSNGAALALALGAGLALAACAAPNDPDARRIERAAERAVIETAGDTVRASTDDPAVRRAVNNVLWELRRMAR